MDNGIAVQLQNMRHYEYIIVAKADGARQREYLCARIIKR